MARNQAEWSNSLSIFWLKKHDYLNREYSRRSGGIKWTYGLGGNESSISFTVLRDYWGTPQEQACINLIYTHTDRWSREKEDVDYKIQLTTTSCNLGGIRYWFVCPLIKNGNYCGRRVGVLYSVGKYFGCRHCADIAYQSQFEGGRFRLGSVTEPDVERSYKEVKRRYYKGRATRKYMRYLRLREKMDTAWTKMAVRLGYKL